MNAADVMDVAREAVIVMLKVGSPIMLLALLVGLTISLFQALTQMQEMTLTSGDVYREFDGPDRRAGLMPLI